MSKLVGISFKCIACADLTKVQIIKPPPMGRATQRCKCFYCESDHLLGIVLQTGKNGQKQAVYTYLETDVSPMGQKIMAEIEKRRKEKAQKEADALAATVKPNEENLTANTGG